MNDDPNAGAPQDAGPDPLEDTQRVEVPRYAPTPDPRPDARWAWASPSGSQPASERWYEPSPGGGSGTPSAGTGAPSGGPAYPSGPGYASSPGYGSGQGYGSGAGYGTPYGGGSPYGSGPYGSTPAWGAPAAGTAGGPASGAFGQAGPATEPVRPRKGGAGVGTVVAASLLSAVIASGGTVGILAATGTLDRPAPVTTQTGNAQPTGGTQPLTINESSAVIDAADKIGPAVVKITTQGQSQDVFGTIPSEGVGSGFIYDASGWILTNRHVVADADKLTVELKDGRQFEGRVYGIDTLTDLAIVKVDQTGLPVATLGTSDGLKVGQLVVAVGSPLGTYSFSVTSGIVSGKGRDIRVDNGTRINNLIQTDAAINPGNSGGPLTDATGAVVGINTAVATDSSGIGFAIPIDIAKPIMEQATKGESLTRPWIGIRFQNIDLQLKKDLSLSVDHGSLVDNTGGTGPAVVENSPAAKAGVQDGDIILSIDGQRIDNEHPLDALLVQFKPGDTVTLDVLRKGSSLQLQVVLGTRPNNL